MIIATLCNQTSLAIPYVLSSDSRSIADGKVVRVAKNTVDRKKVEQLEKFKKLAEQAAHDIDTPLVELEVTLDLYLKNLPERAYAKLKNAITCIKKITQSILEYSPNGKTPVDHEHILVPQALTEIIEQNEFIYSNVEFKYSFDPSLRFTFIYGNAMVFERMMCNLIKNSVEAFEGKGGIVKVGFSVEDDNVEITIEDNGKGMPPKIVEKLMSGKPVPTTKVDGHGLGTQQIRDALTELGGTQLIESTFDVGTKITLTIPKSDKPKDFVESSPVASEGKSEEKTCHDLSSVDVVLLDDSWSFVDTLGTFLQSNGIKKVDTYYLPDDLLKNLSRYSVDIKIFMDNDFKCHISGEDLAKQLTEQGFKNLYILSGSPTKDLRSKYPEGTIFMEKGSETFLDDLVYHARKILQP